MTFEREEIIRVPTTVLQPLPNHQVQPYVRSLSTNDDAPTSVTYLLSYSCACLTSLFPLVYVTVDKSMREEDGSDDEEKDENVEDMICQLLDQRMASQRRDKSCAPSH